jgi:hypothetical protein
MSAMPNILRPDRPKQIIAGLTLAAACLFSAHAAAAQTTRPGAQTRVDAENDPVLKAMLQELDRSTNDLQLKGFAKPFFIQYRIEDVDDFETKAEFGSTEGSSHSHQRVARVTVRVGDARTDSSGARGDGALEIAALDNDPLALRSSLWQATDQAYKNALAAYAQKQAELKEVQTQPQADDFSEEKPVVSLADPACLKVDEASWAERMATASGLYHTNPAASATERDIEYSSANFHARHHHMDCEQRGRYRAQGRNGIRRVLRLGHASRRWHAPRPLLCLDWPLGRRSRLARRIHPA